MTKKQLLLILLLSSSIQQALSQVNVRDSTVSASFISAHLNLQFPGGDLSDRFGFNAAAGASYMYKFRNNMVLGIDYSYIFGDQVKENSQFENITTENGGIINKDGQYTDLRLFERGFTSFVKVGKIFPLLGSNKNSGIMLTAGVGFIQHTTRIETIGNTTPQLSDEYKKGYDHLSNGIAFQQFVGYFNLANNRLVNYYVGMEFNQAFTQNRRDLNFDTMMKDNTKRTDLLNGLRIGFLFPLYKRAPKDFYYN